MLTVCAAIARFGAGLWKCPDHGESARIMPEPSHSTPGYADQTRDHRTVAVTFMFSQLLFWTWPHAIAPALSLGRLPSSLAQMRGRLSGSRWRYAGSIFASPGSASIGPP